MPNDPSSLQARLDAMVRERILKVPRPGDMSVAGVNHAIALDLLSKLDAAEARVKAQDLVIKANSLEGLRGLMEWALQQAKDADAARAALKGGQP